MGGIKYNLAAVKLMFASLAAAGGIIFIVGFIRGNDKVTLISVGVYCLLAISLPLMLKRKFSLFEPVTLLIFSVLIGCTLRAIFFSTASDNNHKIYFLTDGEVATELVRGAVYVPLGLLSLSIGYLSVFKRLPIERLKIFRPEFNCWSLPRAIWVAVLFILVSLVAITKLSTGNDVRFDSLAALSMKRMAEVGGQGASRLGYWVWMSELSRVSGILLLIAIWAGGHRILGFGGGARYMIARALLFVSFLLSMCWPILSSSRTGVLEVIFSLAVILSFMGLRGGARARGFKFSIFAGGAICIAVAVLVLFGVWRQYSQIGEIKDSGYLEAVANNTVGSGNFLPMLRTAIIINRMQGSGQYMLGASYAGVALAPIPRSVWLDKPEIGLGEFVKTEIFGREALRSGYPPGILGEAFINFGFLGLFSIPFLFGGMLRLFYNSFCPLLEGGNMAGLALYSSCLWPVAFQLADLDFSLVVINSALSVMPILVALPLIRRRVR